MASAGASRPPGQGLSEWVRGQRVAEAKGRMQDHLAFSGIWKEVKVTGA